MLVIENQKTFEGFFSADETVKSIPIFMLQNTHWKNLNLCVRFRYTVDVIRKSYRTLDRFNLWFCAVVSSFRIYLHEHNSQTLQLKYIAFYEASYICPYNHNFLII